MAVTGTSTIQTESRDSIPGIDIETLVFVTSYKYSEGQTVSYPGQSGVDLLGGQDSWKYKPTINTNFRRQHYVELYLNGHQKS